MELSDITLRLGQILLVQTSSELLNGRLKYVDPKRKIIELENPYDQRSNCQYNSSQILALPQIEKIQIVLNDAPVQRSNSCSDTAASSTSSEVDPDSPTSYNTTLNSPSSTTEPKYDSQQRHHYVSLSNSELELIHQQLNSVVCITQTDQRYHKALADIRVQPVIALVMEPVEYGRAQRTSILAIATLQTVYIFDIIALGNIFREMKELLAAERPRKAVHYSHKLVDHLKYRHGVKLGGIFDTFVAVSLVRGVKEPMTLIEAVEQMLNITRVYFQPTGEGKHFNDIYIRPLTMEIRQLMAKKAIFQIKLYEHLLHKHMLENFYNQCENFAHTFCENKDATAPLEMQQNNRAGFQHINPNPNEFSFKFNELK